jgi:hypothetical protein
VEVAVAAAHPEEASVVYEVIGAMMPLRAQGEASLVARERAVARAAVDMTTESGQ